MIFHSPGAIVFQIPGILTVRWYGVMIALGFLMATIFATKRAKEWGLDSEKIVNLALTIFISGIVGARLYFVGLSWPYYSSHPAEIIATWNGGLSIHGGLIAAVVVAAIYSCRIKLPILVCCDLMSSTAPLAQAIGRWGNFFNSEAFGRPVADDFPLKLYIPPESRPLTYHSANFFHPTFLFESIWDLGLFLFLYFFASKRLRDYPGVSFFLYVAGYSSGRLMIEPIRVDSIMMAGLPAPIIVSAISLMVAVVGIAILMLKYHRIKKKKIE